MGYHITIRREPGTPEITLDEFAVASASFPELKFDRVLGSAGFFNNGQLAATLKYQDGEVWTKVPEPEVIHLMVRLALSMNAKAYGDEDEWYTDDGQAHYPPGVLESRVIEIQKIKRRRLLVNIVKKTFLAVGLVLFVLKEIRK
jgi:hypothetical protein